MSEILRSMKQPVAQKTINHLKRINSRSLSLLKVGIASQKYRFWQNGGGYDRNIRDGKELLEFIDYVHDNPVKAGLVESSTDWEWSSAREWVLDLRGIIPVDKDVRL
jgi:putative transposase